MRGKLTAVLIVAILCGGWIHGASIPQFLGNPNVTITSINTTTIAASRTSGELPAFVQVSASSITATGTMANGTALNAYEDLDYNWDFGDSAGIENFINPVTGQGVNANTQSGPEAAYVYRTAGVKTITLTTRGCAVPPVSAGSKCTNFRTAISTMTFTVSAFDKSGGEWFFDQVNGLDGNSGLDSAHPKQSISALNALMTADHLQFNLARGSNWVGTTGIYFTRSGIRVVPYGSGANPIINMQNAADGSGVAGASFNALAYDNTLRARSNIVVSNIDVWRSGTTPNSIVNALFGNTTNLVNDNYLDNINVVSDNSSIISAKWIRYQYPDTPDTTNIQRFGVWGGSINKTVGDQAQDIGIYGGSKAWNFFVGITPFVGNGQPANPALVHHIYANFHDHGLFRWINFGSGPNRNFCIKVAVNSLGGGYETGSGWLLAENNMTGTLSGHSGGNSQGADAGLSDVTNLVIQQNAFHGLTQSAASTQNVLSITWRYNNVWNVDTSNALVSINSLGVLSAAELAVNAKFYGNNIYRNNPSAQTSGNSPLNQKVVVATGSATWDNGAGSAGTVLTVTSFSAGLGPNVINGQMPLFANASAPGNAIISGASGSTTTGTYTLSQSFLITPTAGMQFVWGWTVPWTITDNVVQDISTTPTLMDLQFTQQATATVDRNTWYAPNGHLTPGDQTGTPFFNNRFSQTFAQLKAAGSPVLFSIHDVIANPNWTDPANGNFSQ